MSTLTLRSVRKSYGKEEVIHGIDLDIRSGEFVVFVGPSGCGKSTLLRMVAGLEEITSGDMRIDGTLVNDLSPAERGIAMVFQSYALYPHMTVYKNMAFGLKFSKTDPDEVRRRVLRVAEMLQLTPLLDRLPKQLSGGQRQRVAIGRAITREPRLFLFDEPLSNLDAALRVATRIEIANLKASMPATTMIYVTHDQVEAMTLADRIVVLNGGRVEQVGAPLELYESPENLFVAGFMGSPAMNSVKVRYDTGGYLTEGGHSLGCADIPSDTAVLGIRSEDLTFAGEGPPLASGTVSHLEKLGDVTLCYIDIGAAETLIVKAPGAFAPSMSSNIAVYADSRRFHFFNQAGQRIQ